MKGDSWVTIASNDIEVWHALVLAKSLRNVFTSKSITIGITEDVPLQFRSILDSTFDAVIPFHTSEIGTIKNEAFRKSFLKIWCWKLRMWKKCIFIDPNSLVLENVDELFTYYDEFSTSKECNEVDSCVLGTSMFVFRPNTETFDALVLSVENFSDKPIGVFFHSFFQKWSKISVTQIDQLFHNHEFGVQNSKALQPKIITFTSKPWNKAKEIWENKFRVKNAKNKWLDIFHTQICPEVKSEKTEVTKFLLHTIQQCGVPTSNGPLKQVEHTNLGELQDSIAVIGVAGRFPEANNVEEFWNLLISGIDPIRTYPLDRPYPVHDKDIRQAGFLKCPIDEFDAKFFEISPREAQFIDPQQRILLELIWEALENSSIDPQQLLNTNASMFLGIWRQDYDRNLPSSGLTESFVHHKYLGNAFSATAARISNFLGMFGPNIALESGCSSSAAALHLACKSIQGNETNLAIVGGVNLISDVDPLTGTTNSNFPAYSKNFRCNTFDASADGYVRAEGSAVVILKRYSEARYDGDNILGIIRGTSLNNDGPETDFGTPSAVAQARAFREALHNANVSPTEVSYLEAHGTGTSIGDPTEMNAVSQVYKSTERRQPLLISSVKTNIGHTEPCAGLAGLIKIILSMKHKVIPPHLHLKNLNPKIDLASIPAKIPTQVTEWNVDEEKPRIAALNSFGMSGTNVHIIIQEPQNSVDIVPVITHNEMPQMIQISAKSSEALHELVKRYIAYLENINPSEIKIDDIAYHTNVGRASLSHRVAIVANDTTQLLDKLKKKSFISDKIPSQKTKIGFLFTGQGSQYFGMAKSLYKKFVNFKIPLDFCDDLIEDSLGISLKEILWGKIEHLQKAIYCQPAIFAIEYSLAYFWKSFGIEPDYVLGHSAGEFAAATTAGILSLEDALTLVIERSKLVQGLSGGRMLVIRSNSLYVTELVEKFNIEKGMWVDLAAINSDEEVVVSGPTDSISAFSQFIQKWNIKTQELQAETAFHSRDMDPILKTFSEIVKQKIKINEPKCKFVSGVLAKVMESASEFSPDYWVQHLRDTVRFSESIQLLWQECKILVEIGPQPILLGLAMANVNDHTNGSFIPVLRKNEDDVQVTFGALSKIYLSGIKINWKQWFGRRQTKLTLPTYPFQRQKFWLKKDETDDEFVDLSIPHPLLGQVFPSPVSDTIFTQTYNLKSLEYINDHKVVSRVILPATASLETMLAAAQAVVTRGNAMKIPLTIENFTVESAIELDKSIKVQTVVTLEPGQDAEEGGRLQYMVSMHKQIGSDKWKRFAVGYFKPSSNTPGKSPIDLNQIKERINLCDDRVTKFYKQLRDLGIEFGPSFRSIVSSWIGHSEALIKIKLPQQHEQYFCHPIILDAMIQTIFLTAEKYRKAFRLPTGVGKFIYIPNEMTDELYIYRNWGESVEELCIVNAYGVRLGIMDRVELVKSSKDSFIRSLTEQTLDIPYLYEEIYLPKTTTTGNRVDPKLFQIPTKDTTFQAKSAKAIAFKLSVEEYLKQCFTHFLIRGIQECDWNWPKIGGLIRPQDWFTPTQNYLKHLGLFNFFMELLVSENYLTQPNPELSEFKVIKNLPSPSECQIKIDEVLQNILEQDEPMALFSKRCGSCFNDVLTGKMSPLEYMFPKDPNEYGGSKFFTESLLYDGVSEISTLMVLDTIEALASHTEPKILRILEVGAGSGKSASQLMDKLNKRNIPFHYTFTDISQIFVLEASKKFDSNVSFEIFNLENDPLTQGFSPEKFDIILGVQVIHATTNIIESLKACNLLLRENGILVLSEQFRPIPFLTLSFGFLDGWWNFNDFRKSSPMINAEEWKYCLQEAGFEESNCISYADNAFGGVLGKKTKLTYPNKNLELQKPWLILSDNLKLGKLFTYKFNKYGRQVELVEYEMENFAYQNNEDYFESLIKKYSYFHIEGILYVWTENHENYSIQERQKFYCGGLLHLCKAIIKAYENKMPKPMINLITKGLYSFGDENYGPVDSSTSTAVLKVFMNETDFQVKTFDISEDPSFHIQEIEEVFANIWESEKEPFIAVRESKKWVKRLVSMNRKIIPLRIPNTDRYKVFNPETNTINDIEISPITRMELQEKEVEIQVKAVSLNFRDLLFILKPEGFPLPKFLELGFDSSGIVTAVGKEVTRAKVGDEVIAASPGSLSSHIVVSETKLMKKTV